MTDTEYPLTLAELHTRLRASEDRTRNLELLLCALVAVLRPELGQRGVEALGRAREGTDYDERAELE